MFVYLNLNISPNLPADLPWVAHILEATTRGVAVRVRHAGRVEGGVPQGEVQGGGGGGGGGQQDQQQAGAQGLQQGGGHHRP